MKLPLVLLSLFSVSSDFNSESDYDGIAVKGYSTKSTCVYDSNADEFHCGKEEKCISFHVSSGTGCSWMCKYCHDQLDTNNYYFTDGVCKYESGGCQGNPQVGVEYTCCTV